eukprot:1780017-Pyramimonas_sp.AAC.1
MPPKRATYADWLTKPRTDAPSGWRLAVRTLAIVVSVEKKTLTKRTPPSITHAPASPLGARNAGSSTVR